MPKGQFSSNGNESYRDIANKSEEYSDKLFDEEHWRWWNELPADERDAVYGYTATDYRRMNQLLRGVELPSHVNKELIQKEIDSLERAINKFQLKHNMLFHRWSGREMFEQFGITKDTPVERAVEILNAVKGSVITDKGFTSASTWHETFGGTLHEIRTPKGTNVAYVNQHSANNGEREAVFNRGTSYRLLGAELTDNYKLKVNLEVYRENSHGRMKQVRHVGV